MAIDKNAPHTVLLSGEMEVGNQISDRANASATPITPGYLVEAAKVGNIEGWQPNSSATNTPQMFVALEQPELNKTIDSQYAQGDLMHVHPIEPGDVFLGIIPSGVTVNYGDAMQSNGDGKLKAATSLAASAGVAKFISLDDLGAVTVDTRVRAQRVA